MDRRGVIQHSTFESHGVIQHSTFNIQHLNHMAQETPVHEVRPTTQEMKIPARFIPQPVLEPGHTYASVTDHISSIVLRRKMPFGWYIGFMVGCIGVMLLTSVIG